MNEDRINEEEWVIKDSYRPIWNSWVKLHKDIWGLLE